MQQVYQSPDFNNYQDDADHWKRECERLQELLDKANDTIKHLQGFINWENKLFATPSELMSDAHKIIARCLPRIVRKAKERATTDDVTDDGLVRVYREEIAKPTGKSPDRVGAGLIQMHQREMVKRDFKRTTKRVKSKDTGKVTTENDNALFLEVTPSLLNCSFKPAEPRNKGNNQKNFICKACHSSNVVTRKVVEGTCRDCGTINIYDLSKKEDKAFIVDADTAEHFQEWYGTVEAEDIEEMFAPTLSTVPVPLYPDKPQRNCIKCESDCWIVVDGRWVSSCNG